MFDFITFDTAYITIILPRPEVMFGTLSAILSVLAFLPYIFDVLRGHTQPQRACWLIWSVLSTISFVSQVAEGASDTLWFITVQCVGTVTIFCLALVRGSGTLFRRSDIYVLLLAGLGLVLWAVTDTPAYALGLSIGISLMGGAVTVLKAYRAPSTETLTTWVISFIATCFALLAVGFGDWVLLAYPLYLFALYSMIVAAMLLGRYTRWAAGTARAVEFSTRRADTAQKRPSYP